ncbi:MAG: class I SAM-dependent methyltransferase [Candidatus Nanopelagicales bacterium]
MAKPTKWQTETDEGHSQWYIERFRTMAAEGVDLSGEARLIDAMAAPHSRILDAGCGPGRVGAVLAERGHTVVGVDADPELIRAAIDDHPGPKWLVTDLAELTLATIDEVQPFDAVVVAGNVLTFLAEGTEVAVLTNLREVLAPDGFIVVGFGVDRGYSLDQFDHDVAAAGLRVDQRFSTWDIRPWQVDASFAVSVLRHAVSN